MASEKSNETQSKKKSFAILRDERVKFILGLGLVLFSLYMLFSMISFLFTWKADQSFEFLNVISGFEVNAHNWAGKAGAKLANTLVNKGFGISAYIIPFLLFLIGLRLINIQLLSFSRTMKLGISFLILVSLVLGYIFGSSGGFLGSGLGGSHGYYITRLLNSILGTAGTGLLLLIIVFTFLSFAFASFYPWVKLKMDELLKKKEQNNIPNIVQDSPLNGEQGEDEIVFVSEKKTDDQDLYSQSQSFEVIHPNEHEEIAQPEDIESTDEIEDEEIEDTTDDENIEQEEDEDELVIDDKNDEDGFEIIRKNLDENGNYDPKLDLSNYKYPHLELLKKHESANAQVTDAELISNKDRIIETLKNYKIDIVKIQATIGPTVTLYEIIPAPGIRISKIKSLEDDIALSLSALGIRIIAPMPGKGTIGIEVPNQNRQIVSMKTILNAKKFIETKAELPVAIGKTISNETYIFDLAKMPHLLVAGATNQGKSVGLNAIIASLLYKRHPSELKFVFVDPKRVELSFYGVLEKHFLAKLPTDDPSIITECEKVIYTLKSLTVEMEDRYRLLEKAKVRNIKEYNEKFKSRKLNPNKGHKFLPYIVLVIDEFADLIVQAGKEIETPLARLAQKARAIGIHLIIATQRPTTNVVTGLIKANFPARIAFKVQSMIDSRTILDTGGANQLIGAGDMLISHGSDLLRVQCAYIDTEELETLVDFIAKQQSYTTPYYLPEYIDENADADVKDLDPGKRDSLFVEAAKTIVGSQQGSTSLLQRKFSIGYNRAGRIMDQLYAAGIVGPQDGSKARQVLITDELSLDKILNR